jgi:hypothetical protein
MPVYLPAGKSHRWAAKSINIVQLENINDWDENCIFA